MRNRQSLPKDLPVQDAVSAFSDDLNLIAYINSNGSLEGYDVLKKVSAWQPYHLENSQRVTAMAISPEWLRASP